jgi:hypothetical protein
MYRLIWRRDGSEGIKWWLRGIKEDGSFYGDLFLISSDPSRCCGTSVDGVIPQEDWRRCREILHELSSSDPLPPGPCFALLAEAGADGRDRILFQYHVGDEHRSRRAALFFDLIATLEDQVSKAYGRLGCRA